MEFNEAPNLIITPNGQVFMQKIQHFPVINAAAVAATLLPPPEFILNLGDNSHLHLCREHLYFIKQLTETPIRTSWTTDIDGDVVFETPVFFGGQAVAERIYRFPLPTYLIQRIPKNDAGVYNHARTEQLASFWLLTGITQSTPQMSDGTSTRMFTYPFGNIHSDGMLCTGRLNFAGSFHELTEGAIQAWKANTWNADLFRPDDKPRCRNLVRFSPDFGTQMDVDGLPEQFLRPVAPGLPAEVLKQITPNFPFRREETPEDDV